MEYKIYWNNICLLSAMEETFIKQQSNKYNYFPFTFEYYGLGKPYSMTEKIKADVREGGIKGDIIVSTDLDVFQDRAMAKDFKSDFQQTNSLFRIRETIMNTTIPDPNRFFHPFIVIPLVMVINTNLVKESEMPASLKDLLHPSFKHRYAFGGVNNSAGRSLIKSLWYLYGSDAAKKFLSGSLITSMPAQAFQRVITGQVPVAIVPTIFALRRGIQGLKACWPLEGAVAIPSYVAVKNRVNNKDLQLFLDTILGMNLQQQLRNSGDIIPVHPDIAISPFTLENDCKLLYPEWSFFDTFDHEEFYHLCKDYQPVMP
ncbi:ABC transporter substrate-binding protein [Alkaliphilus peptidifermentans]|uniref:Extracellular solute-binding protein n=1 Tax=Alkaliphilus peptidifermentans DSM 18978 TaxID=1120976 RepID=A0A1G5IIK9_9FIRM|nr:ABC transporter substrate-binding protein [Alkaliphilus peptidifermentans]SCY75965.1 extracellular solute-binding protein [Alkaliphilus peptidifermentans DSM 18978]